MIQAPICFVITALCLVPTVSEAALIINEVAWMGGPNSANDEWIELHNTGDTAVDITNWRLSDGANLNIPLAGTVAAGGYALLERNRSSEAYLKTPPFLVYTGALVNTGATLVLSRPDGSTADQVSGGENWQSIGGDNTTKDTAQYTTQGWITARPTPGAANEQTASTPAVTAAPTSQSASSRTILTGRTEGEGTVSRIPVGKEEAQLTLFVEAPSVGYVGQPVSLIARPSGLTTALLNSLKYQWNFGDAESRAGFDTVEHVYRYPGTYIVTVQAAYARHTQSTRHEITILPVSVSLSLTAAGDVQLHNDALYEVDVSGFRIAGAKTVVLPPQSLLLPRSTITIPYQRLGGAPQAIAALYTPERVLVTTAVPAAPTPPGVAPGAGTPAVAQAPRPVVAGVTASAPLTSFTFAPPAPVTPPESLVESEPPTSAFGAPIVSAAERVPSNESLPAAPVRPPAWWTYAALIILLGGTGGALVWQRRSAREVDSLIEE